MRTMTIKSRGTKYEMAGISRPLSLAMLNQYLAQMTANQWFASRLGTYTWVAESIYSQGVEKCRIVARWKADHWVEGRGKTPWLALKDWSAGLNALKDYFDNENPAAVRAGERWL